MRQLLAITLLIAGSFVAQAQDEFDGLGNERIKKFRVEFFNRKLNLSEQEASKFWPIFDAYTKKRMTIRREQRRDGEVALVPDEEVEAFIKRHLDREDRLVDLKRDFFRQAKEVINVRKVAMIPEVEKDFKKRLLREMQRRQGGGQGMDRGHRRQ